jgi:hypothetical protein
MSCPAADTPTITVNSPTRRKVRAPAKMGM